MMSPVDLHVTPGALTLGQARRATLGPIRIRLGEQVPHAVEAAAATIREIVRSGRTVYGVNTGFGRLAQTRIDTDQLEHLQTNLVLSHAAGTGPAMSDSVVRLILLLKVNALAQGHSGVRWTVLEALCSLLHADVLPVVPSQGSVGASGDLAPLAHLAGILLGVGKCRRNGATLSAEAGLAAAGLQPMTLAPKEGLALLNGTQASTALALDALFQAEDILSAAVVAGTLSVDAAKGSDAPFDARLNALRGQSGQNKLAAVYRGLLEGSLIRKSHLDCERVQDPYSLRCQPQVMGACLDALVHAADLLSREANAVSDNPIVFPDTGEVLSGGNFHAEPVAFAADHIALALAEIGSLSERRTALLTDANLSGLPAFLVTDAGVNSGFMIAHVTAAALVSENKQLSHPAVVDSLPTSANQEDHVSMATHGARRLALMARNAATVVGIELLAAAQGIEFHRPMRSSQTLEDAHARVREVASHYEKDRYFAPDIDAALGLVCSGYFREYLTGLLPSTHPDDRRPS